MHKGSCLCGAVSYEIEGALGESDACHCSQCRKWSGHYWASTDVPRTALTVQGADKVTWYRSSEKVQRGFCSVCGSTLFWDPIDRARERTGVSMGSLEAPTGAKLHIHIFVADKGDYYEVGDPDVPQYAISPRQGGPLNPPKR